MGKEELEKLEMITNTNEISKLTPTCRGHCEPEGRGNPESSSGLLHFIQYNNIVVYE